jgi:hypothetical protein
MPAVMMTSVMPMAMTAVTAVWEPMLKRLSAERKTGEANERKIKTTIRAPGGGELGDGTGEPLAQSASAASSVVAVLLMLRPP